MWAEERECTSSMYLAYSPVRRAVLKSGVQSSVIQGLNFAHLQMGSRSSSVGSLVKAGESHCCSQIGELDRDPSLELSQPDVFFLFHWFLVSDQGSAVWAKTDTLILPP